MNVNVVILIIKNPVILEQNIWTCANTRFTKVSTDNIIRI